MMYLNRSLSIRRLLIVGVISALLVLSGCGGSDTSSPDPTDPTDGAAGALACHDLFSDEEITELFSDPAALENEKTVPSIGQTVCVWGTIEDPDDADDLQSQTLTIQVYSGDPVPGENFYDSSIFGDGAVRELDDIGDQAYVAGEAGMTAFLDGDIAGFVSYAAIDFGESDQVAATEDQVIDILRQLHNKVT